jgi:hypothetical protein
MRRSSICSLALVVVLVAAAGAAASSRDTARIRLTPEGQRDAKAALLTIGDFTPGSGFTGGPVKSSPSSQLNCPGFHPKQSDLVENGDATATFKNRTLHVASEATIFQTAQMVRDDWARTIRPALVPCLRSALARTLPANERVVSFAELPFPKVSTYTHAYRGVLLVTPKIGKPQKLAIDTVLISWGRTEIGLTTMASAGDATLIQADIALAKTLASRIYT